MSKTFTGTSEQANAPFLEAGFWKKGVRIEGIVLRTFQTMFGENYVLHLKTPVKVKGKAEQQVSLGQNAGLKMALNACGAKKLQEDDVVILECTGTTDVGKESPRTDFKIAVTRK